MKLANGYGSITKLQGKRRNPWMVRITTGKDENGNPIRKVLGYYSSNALAIAALSDFNREPYDLASRKLTFADIYKQWIETVEFEKLSDSAKNVIEQLIKNILYCIIKPLPQLKLQICKIVLTKTQAVIPLIEI